MLVLLRQGSLLIAAGAVFALTLAIADETSRIRIGGDRFLAESVTYGRPGVCSLRMEGLTSGNSCLLVPIPPNTWMNSDSAAIWPVAKFSRGQKSDCPLLSLTLSLESGVYGYKKVLLYRVNCRNFRRISLSAVGEFEFSDFGSWTMVGNASILTWDADLSDGPHQGPHPYVFRWLAIGKSVRQVSKKRSMKSYNPGWDANGARPISILTRNDPLRELGLRWKWWGQPPVR